MFSPYFGKARSRGRLPVVNDAQRISQFPAMTAFPALPALLPGAPTSASTQPRARLETKFSERPATREITRATQCLFPRRVGNSGILQRLRAGERIVETRSRRAEGLAAD